MIDDVFGRCFNFYKLQGCGNDFVIIDNRELGVAVDDMPDWVTKICKRAFGIYADGLIFLDKPDGRKCDYIWHFYNSDGSRAEMCGNGARCAAMLAWHIGLAPQKHLLGTDAGIIRAEVFPEQGEVDVQLTKPADMKLNVCPDGLNPGEMSLHFVNTGVPHAVVVMKDEAELDALNILELGPKLRHDPFFGPKGTNVNFITVIRPDFLRLRTFERGVEDETYACGTGAAASVVIANALGLVESSTRVETTGKESLGVSLRDGFAFLRGSARLVFKGQAYYKALGLKGE